MPFRLVLGQSRKASCTSRYACACHCLCSSWLPLYIFFNRYCMSGHVHLQCCRSDWLFVLIWKVARVLADRLACGFAPLLFVQELALTSSLHQVHWMLLRNNLPGSSCWAECPFQATAKHSSASTLTSTFRHGLSCIDREAVWPVLVRCWHDCNAGLGGPLVNSSATGRDHHRRPREF